MPELMIMIIPQFWRPGIWHLTMVQLVYPHAPLPVAWLYAPCHHRTACRTSAPPPETSTRADGGAAGT